MKDTVNYRHYLFRDKFDPESELFMEWYTNDMLERLDSMKDGDTIHFDPPADIQHVRHEEPDQLLARLLPGWRVGRNSHVHAN